MSTLGRISVYFAEFVSLLVNFSKPNLQGLIYIRNYQAKEAIFVQHKQGSFQIRVIAATRKGRREIFVARVSIFIDFLLLEQRG